MNLLVTGAWDCTKEQLDEIASLGHNVLFLQREADQFPCDYEWVEGTICNGLFVHHNIELFSNLKYIQTTSAGLDRIPVDYCAECHIVVKNARGVYSIPMAEFAINGVLMLYKRSKVLLENQKQHKWEKLRNLQELNGKNVLIVGCGSVGFECAKRFKAFGCTVSGVDLEELKTDCFDEIRGLPELDYLLPFSDVVVLTLPLTKRTWHMFNKDRFMKMRTGSILVNIARGAIVEETALLDALDGPLFGAVIDVFEEEPVAKDSLLWNKNNLVFSPHNSFISSGNNERLFNLIVKNLRELSKNGTGLPAD